MRGSPRGFGFGSGARGGGVVERRCQAADGRRATSTAVSSSISSTTSLSASSPLHFCHPQPEYVYSLLIRFLPLKTHYCLLRECGKRFAARSSLFRFQRSTSQSSRRGDPERARMQSGSSGIVYGGLKYQASFSAAVFWSLLLEQPAPNLVHPPHLRRLLLAGAVHRRRARGGRLDHLPRRDAQPQGGERGAFLQ